MTNPDAGAADYAVSMGSGALFGLVDPTSTSVSLVMSAGAYGGAKLYGASEEEAQMAMMMGDLVGGVTGGSVRGFKEVLGRGASIQAARSSALLSVSGVDVGGMAAGGAYASATGGDVWTGMQHGLMLANTGMAGVQLAKRICFAPETPLLTPGGSKPISEFKVGDYILSAPDWDPEAPVSVQLVEEVFENYGRLLNLHVGGQVVRTTAEHPFYVKDKGWIACEALEPGDLLRSHDGKWVTVEEVTDDETESVVYNLRVSEYHTYFVGEEDWGFSVWAHNVYLTKEAKTRIARDWIAAKNVVGAADPIEYTQASYGQRMKIRAIAHQLIKADPSLLKPGARTHGNFATQTPGVLYNLVRMSDDPGRQAAGFSDYQLGSVKKIGETIDARQLPTGEWLQKRYTQKELKNWNVAFFVVDTGPQIQNRANQTTALKAYEQQFGHLPELNENYR